MLRARTLFRQASVFTSSVLLSSSISALAGLAIARLLSPDRYGVFQGIQVLWQYALYAHLGTPWAMQREVAQAESTGQAAAAQQAVEVTLTFVTWSTLLLGVALTLVAIWRGWPFPPTITALAMAALLGRQLYGVFQFALTARQQFWSAGRTDVVAAAANLLLTIVLTARFGLPGLLVAQVGWAALGSALLVRQGRLRLRWRPDWQRLAGQVRLGLQFTSNSFLQVSAKNSGRLVILALAGTTALGYYGIAMLVAGYVEVVGGALGRSLLPSIVGVYEQRREAADMRAYVLDGGPLLGLLLGVGAGAAALLLPLVVRLLLPRYLAGVPAGQVLLIGSVFVLLRYSVEPFYVALLTLYRTFAAQALGIALAVIVAWLALRSGAGLVGVAGGALLGSLVVSGAFFGAALRRYERSAGALLRGELAVHLPALLAGALALLLSRVVGDGTSTVGAALLATLAQMALYTLACLPLLWYADRRFGLRRQLSRWRG